MPIFNYLAVFRRIHKKRVHLAVIILMPISRGWAQNPFMNLAAQKSHYGFYHMGIYAMPELESWFRVRYAEAVPTKLDMGKSCIRFKNPKHIPYNLIGELVSKVSVDDWISVYQSLKK